MRDGKEAFYRKLQLPKEIRKLIQFYREIKIKMQKENK